MAVLPVSAYSSYNSYGYATQVTIDDIPLKAETKTTSGHIEEIKANDIKNDETTSLTFKSIDDIGEKITAKKFREQDTHAFRAYKISQIIEDVCIKFDSLKLINPENPSKMPILLNIRSMLNDCWNIIKSDDDKEAFLVNAIEDLLSTSFWKSYSNTEIDEITKVMNNYNEYTYNELQDIIIDILGNYKNEILPTLE